MDTSKRRLDNACRKWAVNYRARKQRERERIRAEQAIDNVLTGIFLPSGQGGAKKKPPEDSHTRQTRQRAEERVALAKCQDLLYRKSHDFLAKDQDPLAARVPAQPSPRQEAAALVDGYGNVATTNSHVARLSRRAAVLEPTSGYHERPKPSKRMPVPASGPSPRAPSGPASATSSPRGRTGNASRRSLEQQVKRLEEELRAAQGKQRTAPHASPSESQSPRLPAHASPVYVPANTSTQRDGYVAPRSSAEIVEVVSRRTVFPPLPRTPPPAQGFARKAQPPDIYIHHQPPQAAAPDEEFSWERYRSSRTWSPTLS